MGRTRGSPSRKFRSLQFLTSAAIYQVGWARRSTVPLYNRTYAAPRHSISGDPPSAQRGCSERFLLPEGGCPCLLWSARGRSLGLLRGQRAGRAEPVRALPLIACCAHQRLSLSSSARSACRRGHWPARICVQCAGSSSHSQNLISPGDDSSWVALVRPTHPLNLLRRLIRCVPSSSRPCFCRPPVPMRR
jgi:hypothetical protein